jgi:hypothetical protein
MELFLHPWYMIAGGILVSAPIIIHLINRMRFKRIRWAAMEFLLKSQKRNRRRLIIEQLLLLLLRILMVLLVAFLVARFVGGALAATGTGTLHAVVIDDTLSMADRWVKDGATTNSFEKAKERVRELAKEASDKSAAHYIRVILLSEPEKVLLNEQISNLTPNNLEKALADKRVTALHVPPHVGLLAAQEEILGAPQGQKIIHLVSDFRETDWSSGPHTAKLTDTVEKLLANRINLVLVDTAHPHRNQMGGLAHNHENVCILSLKADSRIIPEGVDINFEVVVRNNGNNNASGKQLTIRVNGREENRGSILLPPIPAGQDHTHRFDLRFTKASKAPVEYVHIRAEIKPDEVGLEADHVRDLVLELRSKIPVLVVDGKGDDGNKQGGDMFYIQPAIDATGSYVAVPATLAELEKLPLETYAAIYLLNVKGGSGPSTTLTDKIIERLKEYVNKGGNLAFFLGPEIQASFYNEILHTREDGLFPVLIDTRPTEPLTPEERKKRLQDDPQNKILYKNKSHPIVREAFAQNGNLHLVIVDRYHPVKPRSQWTPNAQKEVEEILTLPSTRTVESFKNQMQELSGKMAEAVRDLANTDEEVKKYVPIIDAYRIAIRDSLGEEFLYRLTVVLDKLLNDPGDPPPDMDKPEDAAKPRRPSMVELWGRPQLKAIAAELNQIRESALYGDPLLVARPYGKGKVVAFLSSAGPQNNWNKLADGDPGSGSTFAPMIMELQYFLTSQMDTQNRIVSAASPDIKFSFPEEQYGETLEVRYLAHPNFKVLADAGQAAEEKPYATITMTKKDEAFTYTFTEGKKPGVYIFEATRKKAEAGAEKERTLFAFNVDPEAESNLKRAPRERLDKSLALLRENKAREAKVYFADMGESIMELITKNQNPDASESPWLYLLFLIILIAEQALAVHLSFHLKGNDAHAPTERAAPQATAA